MRALALLLALAVPVPAAPGPHVEPCVGGGANFAGSVIFETFAPGGVKLEWTVWEDASTREYRIGRRASGCGRPSCVTSVGRVRASGKSAAPKTYTFIDTAPPGAWIYRLEVRRTHGGSCTLETAEVLVPSPPPCDTAALCAQVEASFAGSVIVSSLTPDTVKLEWAVHAETGTGAYRLSRFNCANPRDCSTEVATVDATGSCGQVMLHSVTDMVSAGAWTYVLDVLDSAARVACSLRLPAPASPVPSR